MPIRILPEQVAARIAAGEVIERPASVVKELVENAIDAGATEIKVESREGGRRLIRVIDNGCGIPADEVELAFQRHATSKLASVEDLEHITTLGFRGEALPSIAAVAQVTLVTRARHEAAGSLIRLADGKVIQRARRGMPPGTVVTVENLFYNTPARLKFLKSVATEAGHIYALVTRYAMAFSELRFTLVSDGRTVFQSMGTGDVRDVLAQVYGLETAMSLLSVESEQSPAVDEDVEGTEGTGSRWGVALRGFVSPPSAHRGSRGDISLFVNRRWVHDRSLNYAVTEAYRTLLPVGRFPLAVLFLNLDPAAVDVNVHPAKAEVRFREAGAVFAAVQRTVRRTLLERAPIPGVGHRLRPGEPAWSHHGWVEGERPVAWQAGLELQRTGDVGVRGELEMPPPGRLPMLRVVGQVAQAYIVAEGPEGLYLIDQHAAHERVLYEQLQATRAGKGLTAGSGATAQQLLEPRMVELSPGQEGVLSENLALLTELGFDLEPFGGSTYLLRAVPAFLSGTDPAGALVAVLDEMAAGGAPLGEEREARLIASICKQAAVKAGQTLSTAEMQALVQQLEATTAPRTCPHGRPTMIHLSTAFLAREFGRG